MNSLKAPIASAPSDGVVVVGVVEVGVVEVGVVEVGVVEVGVVELSEVEVEDNLHSRSLRACAADVGLDAEPTFRRRHTARTLVLTPLS